MNDDKKCGLECIRTNAARMCVKPEKGQCPRCKQIVEEVQEHYRQLEASYSQVSEALCGKGKASLTEILEAITQVKAERDDARMNHAHVARLLENTVQTKERFKNLFVKAVKEKQAALDALPRWRSMKEEPPERPTGVTAKLMGEEYLVCIQGAGSSTTLHYFPDGSWRDEDDNRYPVEWWMPKPEVKREGKRNEHA